MSDRRYIPVRLGAAGPCDPITGRPHLPLVKLPPGMSGPPSAPADQKQRFHAFNSITTPAPGSSNVPIVGYTVPPAHQARVVGLMLFYEGSGFFEGDAALLFWSLRLNGANFIQDYDVIPNRLGSLEAGPWPVPGAIKLSPDDLLEILVTVPLGSTIATGGTSRVHGHLVGTYEPVQ